MREGAESVEQISQAQAMEEAKLGALQPVSAAVIADWERRKVEVSRSDLSFLVQVLTQQDIDRGYEGEDGGRSRETR